MTKKSIIATSRQNDRNPLHNEVKTGELFDSMPEKVLNRKLTQYGLM
ncbi:hypothetical protein LEP1GSC045_1913 [Leptospira interrogans serovar Pomona str. Kennewicki LC82-25]|nr:hypothetical protein LEP1GSC045_1913 [Leptospira interrogans serovar Pomona str. Kennewicki LC82-25]